jgi:HEAT repeat protein
LAPVPHERIRECEDRSWSLKLVDEIVAGHEDSDFTEVIHTLVVLDDPRVVSPLTKLMENTANSDHLRSVASDVLNKCTTWETSQERKKWWSSGDEILMRHAVRMAERSETNLIEETASDPNHPFYIDAIQKLAHCFEEPRFQLLKIKALFHSSADVRATAAGAILWDQPVAAEDGLLMVAQDEDDSAGAEALDALAYYGSQKVLLALHNMSASGSCHRRPECKTVVEYISRDFLSAYDRLLMQDSAALPVFESWLKPVWEVLEIERHNLIAGSSNNQKTPSSQTAEDTTRIRPSIAELEQRFSNPDGAWGDRWPFVTSVDWASYSSEERTEFVQYCSAHQDWSVRELFCSVLGKWHATDTLLGFIEDPVFTVRKMAAYYLSEVPRDHRVAKRLLQLLHQDDTCGFHASETLNSYVAHASAANLDAQLVDWALNDQRESVRAAAIWNLDKRRSREQLPLLMPLLHDAPLVTWSVHQAVLTACLNMEFEPNGMADLADIDDMECQATLATLKARKSAL